MKTKPAFAENIDVKINKTKFYQVITSLAFLVLTICGSITLTLGLVLIGNVGGFSILLSGLLTTLLSGYTTVVEIRKL